MHIILETPRLVFRRFTEADAKLIMELHSDPLVLQFLHEPLVTTEEEAREIIKKIIIPQYKLNLGRWALHTRDNNKFIGWCGLKYNAPTDETDLGYRLSNEAWGKGYATEAAEYTLQYGFDTLQLKRIIAHAHVQNTASINVLEKLGMKYTRDEVIDDIPVKTFVAINNL